MKKTITLLLVFILTMNLCACGGSTMQPVETPTAGEDITVPEMNTDEETSEPAPEPTPEATLEPAPESTPMFTPEPDPDPVMVEFPEYGFRYDFPMEYLKTKGQIRWVTFEKRENYADYPRLYYIFATKDMIEASSLKDEILNNYVISQDTLDKWREELSIDWIGCHEIYNSLPYFYEHHEPGMTYEINPDGSVVGRKDGKDNYVYMYDYTSGEANVGYLYGDGLQINLRYGHDTAEYKLKDQYGDNPEMKELLEECLALCADEEVFVSGFLPLEGSGPFTYIPVGSALTAAQKAKLKPVVFETTDLDGNPVISEDLFADHKVTAIYIWATQGFQKYSQQALPDLEALSEAYMDQGCQLIGICNDITINTASMAKNVLSDCGVTFLNLVPPPNMEEIFGQFEDGNNPVNSFFVDNEGNFLVLYECGASANITSHGLVAALKVVENDSY